MEEEAKEEEEEGEEFHKGSSRLRGTRARPQVSHCPHQLDVAMILFDTRFAFLVISLKLFNRVHVTL